MDGEIVSGLWNSFCNFPRCMKLAYLNKTHISSPHNNICPAAFEIKFYEQSSASHSPFSNFPTAHKNGKFPLIKLHKMHASHLGTAIEQRKPYKMHHPFCIFHFCVCLLVCDVSVLDKITALLTFFLVHGASCFLNTGLSVGHPSNYFFASPHVPSPALTSLLINFN